MTRPVSELGPNDIEYMINRVSLENISSCKEIKKEYLGALSESKT